MTSPTALCRRALFASLLAFAGSLAAAEPAESTRIEVTWTDPSALTETKDAHGRGWNRGEAWLVDLRKHLVRQADRVLPTGERLEVTFTDIKLAGSFEPWRGPRFDDVRIVKDIYPPRIDLRFTVKSADGSVLADGERTLRDPGFLTRSIANTSDPLRYEKRMLDEWVRREFKADNRGS